MTSSDAFGIYVHWPFCKAKCPYCDFNSHEWRGSEDARSVQEAYIDALRPVTAQLTVVAPVSVPSLLSMPVSR